MALQVLSRLRVLGLRFCHGVAFECAGVLKVPAVAHCDYARRVLVSGACARIVDVGDQRDMHKPAAFGRRMRVLGVVQVRVDLDAINAAGSVHFPIKVLARLINVLDRQRGLVHGSARCDSRRVNVR